MGCVRAAVCVVIACGSAMGGVTLSGFATADNAFVGYVSTAADVAGTEFVRGNNWPSTFFGSVVIDAPGSYYLHVRAQDLGRPEMFIGAFTLSEGGTFGNGGSRLVTNTTDWVVSTSGFGVGAAAPVDLGANGAGPWFNFASIDSDARFIWSREYADGVAYFSARFEVVPGVGAGGVLAMSGLVCVRRRR